MSHEVRHNLRKAGFLYEEVQKSGLDYGCVEISLTALGSATHLVEVLNGNISNNSYLFDVIKRKGFDPSWYIDIPSGSTGSDIEDLLEGRYDPEGDRPKGRLAGYLGMEGYEDDRDNHVIAILPRQLMPRDLRLQLKIARAYVVVDTAGGGTLMVTANSIAHYINAVIESGGGYAISQLWKK